MSAGDFIVDDDGMGYADIGEEEDWGRADEKSSKEADGNATSKKRKDSHTAGTHGAWDVRLEHDILGHCSLSAMFIRCTCYAYADQRGSKRKSAEPDPKARQRMQGMFKRAPVRTVQHSTATDQSSEDLLSDILGSIGGDTG